MYAFRTYQRVYANEIRVPVHILVYSIRLLCVAYDDNNLFELANTVGILSSTHLNNN